MEPNRLRNNRIKKHKGEPMEVILDTNFLTIPHERKIDIFKEIKEKNPKTKLITLTSVKEELNKLDTKASEVAKQLLKEKNIKIITPQEKEHTDNQIIKEAKKRKAAVATNDKELKKRCRKKKIPLIYLRSNKKIEIEKRKR